MEPDWPRLGRALAAARDQVGLTQNEIAERIGVTRTAIQSIERGDTRKKVTGTMRSYARLIGWTDDSVTTVLAGGDPTLVSKVPPEQTSIRRVSSPKNLPLRVVQELEDDGPYIDAQVIDLAPFGSDAKMIVVVKPQPDASPEEVRQALLAWEKAELRLRADSGDETPPAADEA